MPCIYFCRRVMSPQEQEQGLFVEIYVIVIVSERGSCCRPRCSWFCVSCLHQTRVSFGIIKLKVLSEEEVVRKRMELEGDDFGSWIRMWQQCPRGGSSVRKCSCHFFFQHPSVRELVRGHYFSSRGLTCTCSLLLCRDRSRRSSQHQSFMIYRKSS